MLQKTHRIILVGDNAVGKTHFFHKYILKESTADILSTVGVDFHTLTNPYHSSLQFWDTAGREVFRSITTSYFRGAAAFLLFFDLTQSHTFLTLDSWVDSIIKYNKECSPIFLIGTMAENPSLRKITEDDIQNFTWKYNIYAYHEIAMSTDTGISELFEDLQSYFKPAPKPAAGGPTPQKSYWSFIRGFL